MNADEVYAMLKSNNSYTNEEITTKSTWFDGKPIYKKYIEYTLAADTADYTEVTLVDDGNIESITNITGFSDIIFESYTIHMYVPNRYINMFVSSGNIKVEFTSPVKINTKLQLIVEYTKTTD